MIIHVAVDDPTPECPTCGDSRVASLRWGGAWTPEPCPDCSPKVAAGEDLRAELAEDAARAEVAERRRE